MNFSEKFASNSPFKNVEEPKQPELTEEEKKRLHAVASINYDKVESSGGVDLGTIQSTKKKEEEKETTPLIQGGYEGAADVVGAATYIPTAHMYTDMFTKIGQAAMDIESNMKGKEKADEMKKWLKDNPTLTADSPEYKNKYTQVYGKPPKSNNKYKENDDGTFSLIT